MDAPAEDLRRWLEQRRAAARRELLEQRNNPPEPGRALRRGLALIAFASKLRPPALTRPDPSIADRRAYQRWARLRSALLGQ